MMFLGSKKPALPKTTSPTPTETIPTTAVSATDPQSRIDLQKRISVRKVDDLNRARIQQWGR